jgi:hypothetical protein
MDPEAKKRTRTFGTGSSWGFQESKHSTQWCVELGSTTKTPETGDMICGKPNDGLYKPSPNGRFMSLWFLLLGLPHYINCRVQFTRSCGCGCCLNHPIYLSNKNLLAGHASDKPAWIPRTVREWIPRRKRVSHGKVSILFRGFVRRASP